MFKERDGDFSIDKYFMSYRKIKRNPLFLGHHINDFVISTNISIDKNIEYLFDTISENDSLLDTPGWNSRRLKFNGRAIQKLRPIFQACTDSGQLAKKLTEVILKNKRFDFQDKLFQKYHGFLVTYIIDVEQGTFRDIFFDLGELNKFRDIFFDFLIGSDSDLIQSITNFLGYVLLTEMPTGNHFNSAYIQGKFGDYLIERQIKKHRMQFRKEFKSKKADLKPNFMEILYADAVVEEEIRDFVARFVFAVEQPNEAKLSEIIAKELGQNNCINTINDELSFTIFFVIMLDWLKTKGNCFLSHEEANNFMQHIKYSLDAVKLYVLTSQYEVVCASLSFSGYMQ